MNKIAVLGPGAVGGFLAVALARTGCQVVCVARQETCKVINESGIDLESTILGKVNEKLPAVPYLEEPVDLLLITPKAPALEAALARIKAPCRSIVPFLNGLDHMELIRANLTGALAAAAIYIEAVYPAPGKIRHVSDFCRIEISRGLPDGDLADFTWALEHSGIGVKVFDNDAQVLWRKLIPLNALACVTSAAGGDMGKVRSEQRWPRALEECLREGAAVAKEYGVVIQMNEILETFRKLPDSFSSSMQRDLAAGRTPELEAIPGALLREASRVSLDCPTVRSLVDSIKSAKGGQGGAVRAQ